jgi:hypothetical protein
VIKKAGLFRRKKARTDHTVLAQAVKRPTARKTSRVTKAETSFSQLKARPEDHLHAAMEAVSRLQQKWRGLHCNEQRVRL